MRIVDPLATETAGPGASADRPPWPALAAAALCAALAAVVALGWALDVPALRSAWPGAVEMKANTALGLFLAACALALTAVRPHDRRARAAAGGLGLVVALLGAATAWQYATGRDLGIDELLVRDTGAAFNVAKGRMSPYSAVAFGALGLALLLRSCRRAPQLQRAAAGLVLGVGLVSVIGYLWNAAEIVTDRIAPPVAINTGFAFAMLGAALLLRAPGTGARGARTRVETLVLRSLWPIALLIFVGGGVTYESAAGFARAVERVDHTQQVRVLLARMASAIADADLARRNQLLTGDASFGREFGERVAQVRRLSHELGELVQDNPAQTRLQQQLAAALASHIALLESVAATAARAGHDDPRAALAAQARDGSARAIRELDRRMDQAEVELLAARLGRAEAQRTRALLWMMATLAISVLLFALLFRGIRGEMRARREVERGLQQLNAQLEQRTVDLHQANRELQQARLDSEAASRAKSAFLANMSHEIRTPMNAVIGLTHLMQRETSDTRQRERLAKVSDAAHHLLQLINDILDMSKIEAGKLVLAQAEFSLEALLASATEMVGVRAREKGLELVLDNEGVPPQLVGDAVRLSQVLINLLSNAVKFTDHGWVRLRCRVAEERGARLLLRFEVQDTGPGIALERQALLFKAFEQADTSMSRRHEGTGLGLALSRQLALAMGGEAGVVSTPGAGSTFWFTAEFGQGSQAATPAVQKATKGLRALVVDDLPESLAVIGERLRSLGFEVDAVNSGPAALQHVESRRAAAGRYDVLVVDWRMEPMDGIETLARIRALLADGTPPSILATAFDDPRLAAQARAVRYDAVVLKPITASALHDTLARVLQGAAATAPTAQPGAPGDGERRLRERHAGQRVLLAEDNAVNREVAQALLRAAGLEVDTAADGAEAVRLALTRSHHLLLMDVHMPVLDGLDATREIRRSIGWALPVVAMTANAFDEDRRACLEAGMNDHVAKPVDPDALYQTLLRWLPDAPAPLDAVARAGPAPAPAKEDALRQRLHGVQGLDLGLAVRNVGGHFPALAAALRRFASLYAGGLAPLLHADDRASEQVSRAWRAACHSMRGALASVGATELLRQTEELEAALDAGAPAPDRDRLGRHLHDSLVAFVQRLQAALAS